LARKATELADSDIAHYAHEMLEQSTIEEVVVLGRRGPAEAAFSPKEVKELGELDDVDLVVDAEQVKLDAVSEAWMKNPDAPRTATKNVEFLREVAAKGPGTARPRRARPGRSTASSRSRRSATAGFPSRACRSTTRTASSPTARAACSITP